MVREGEHLPATNTAIVAFGLMKDLPLQRTGFSRSQSARAKDFVDRVEEVLFADMLRREHDSLSGRNQGKVLDGIQEM